MSHERAVVAGALGLMLLHTVDEALLHPEAGGRVNLALGLVLAGAVVALFPRMPRGVRVGVLGFLGLQGVVAGTTGHVVHLFSGNAAALDYSGVLFVIGGAVLLTVAVAEARTRGEHHLSDPSRARSGRSVRST